MKFSKLVIGLFCVLMLIVNTIYAQEVAKTRSIASESREQPLLDAEALMKAGSPADAYDLLEPLEFERSGEVRFDYLIGIAALDSGKPDKATLAFERVLAVDPNYAGARMEMARAYFQLGDLERAKTEFEQVSKQNPPEAARITIKKYLDLIAEKQAAKKTRLSAYVEGGGGYDTNINNSTTQMQISVPYFNSALFTLSPTNRKTTDYYYSVATGGEINHSLDDNWGLYAGADVRQRGNLSKYSFNYLNLDGHAGVTYKQGVNVFRIGGLGGMYYVGNQVGGQYNLIQAFNRDSLGVTADWRHIYSPSDQMSLFAQYGRNRFSKVFWDPQQLQFSDLSVNDFDQRLVGIGGLHAIEDGKYILFGNLFWADEVDVAPATLNNPSGGRVDGNKRTLGLRAGGQAALSEGAELFAGIGLQSGVYDKFNSLFFNTRNDRQLDLTAGADLHLDKNWTVRPKLSYLKNGSNIVIYSYDRIDVSLTVRGDFR